MEEGNLSAKAKTEAWEGIPGGNLTRGSLTLHPLPWYLLNHGLSGKAPVQSCPARSQQLTGREAARFCARRNRGGIKRNGDICACHHLPGKARQGESGGTDSSRRVARPLVSSHAERGRAARRGHTVQPVRGHTRAAAFREERALSSPYTMSCSCQVRAKTVSLRSKWQLNTQNYKEASVGDRGQQGESSPLCAPGAPGHYQ